MYGSTSPITEAGTLALLNAELLAGLVFAQLIKPGSKIIMGIIIAIAVPAFLYSLWAITGLEYEIILYGAILLSAGIPFYYYLNYLSRRS
ncbi:MAG TPA: hypothetical protein ENI20_16180 [Bacteroides sp.]|nr:hypothetical protein [Bacteroides sp.]